ncbi:MAG: threonine synthase, partial [bacterium]
MKFFSTRNSSSSTTFKNVLLNGLAPDGGLYMPEIIPRMPMDLLKAHQHFEELAVSVIHPYTKDQLTLSELTAICEKAFNFPLNIKNLNEDDLVLELFHGPTLAFKDFAARFMAQTMSHFQKDRKKNLTILVATSGDTGGAVANSFYNLDGINVIVLYPSKKVSSVQEKQLTTLGGNITALEVLGTFDDCQSLVKKAFVDEEIQRSLYLSSANSINFARLLPQAIYYMWAWKKCNTDESVCFSIPSGNFGNLTGGLLANQMGLPVEKFIASLNVNDTFLNYLKSGKLIKKETIKTISNAMDVSVPSNIERISCLYGDDVNEISKKISSWSFTDSLTKNMIKNVFDKYDYLI